MPATMPFMEEDICVCVCVHDKKIRILTYRYAHCKVGENKFMNLMIQFYSDKKANFLYMYISAHFSVSKEAGVDEQVLAPVIS